MKLLYCAFFFVLQISIINAYLYGNRINISEIETLEKIDEVYDRIYKELKEYKLHRNDLEKFNDIHDYKCFGEKYKKKCVINSDSYEHIDFVNYTIGNNTVLESKEKSLFNKYVNNFKSINYLHYKNEFLLEDLDDFDDYYYQFPTELYAYGGYFRYTIDEESKIKILNYLDSTRTHLKNILDYINGTNQVLEHYNPDIIANYNINYRIIKKHRNKLWWYEFFGWLF